MSYEGWQNPFLKKYPCHSYLYRGKSYYQDIYNPQNEMFLTFQTNRSFLKNETASKEHKKNRPFRQ